MTKHGTGFGGRLARVAAMVCASLWLAGAAQAADKVTLKNGTVVEGTIIREVDGYVWLKYQIGGIDHEQMYQPGEIESIDRDAPAKADAAAPVVDTKKADAPMKDGVPRAAVITLGSRDEDQGNMVGVYFTEFALKQMMPMLQEELGDDGSGVVVMRITSGGGLSLEMPKISDQIHNQYKRHFRVVSWIDSAISAAAMSSQCVEEIYFTPQGNYGACTEFSGNLVASKDRDLESVLYLMEKISARGGYNPLIMRAMQIQQPLSATIDANGEVHWYGDATSGDILVNRPGEILTFNAETARKVKFSKGTASTIDDLRKLMGYQELHWVGKEVKGTPWPVCQAEDWNIRYRKQVHKDEEHFQEYVRSYQAQIAAATGESTREARGKFVNQARQSLQRIKDACRTNPNFALLHLNINIFDEPKALQDFFDREERRLRDLLR